MDVMRKLAFAIVAAAGVWAEGVAAEPPSDEARLACRREAAPGRVLCELEVEVTDSTRVAFRGWVDIHVVAAATP